MTAYSTATQAYTQSSVLTAPPERLVVMLYDGAGRFLARAAAALRDGDAGAAGEPLQRTHAILDELLATLNAEAGEIAERLESIYRFCKQTLTEAQLQRDAAAVERVAELLAELRDAWARIAAGAGGADAAGAPPGIGAGAAAGAAPGAGAGAAAGAPPGIGAGAASAAPGTGAAGGAAGTPPASAEAQPRPRIEASA